MKEAAQERPLGCGTPSHQSVWGKDSDFLVKHQQCMEGLLRETGGTSPNPTMQWDPQKEPGSANHIPKSLWFQPQQLHFMDTYIFLLSMSHLGTLGRKVHLVRDLILSLHPIPTYSRGKDSVAFLDNPKPRGDALCNLGIIG